MVILERGGGIAKSDLRGKSDLAIWGENRTWQFEGKNWTWWLTGGGGSIYPPQIRLGNLKGKLDLLYSILDTSINLVTILQTATSHFGTDAYIELLSHHYFQLSV